MTEAMMETDSVDRFRIREISSLPSRTESNIVGNSKRFLTIEETANQTGLSVYYLRQGIRAGWIPHIRCGCKAMINYAKLIEMLDMKSTANAEK